MERWYRADYDVVGIDDMHDDYFDADCLLQIVLFGEVTYA